MSSTMEGSTSQLRSMKKCDKGRRVWTSNEEDILLASVKEIIANGWKSDNSFRPGYLNKLEVAMKQHFPSTDLRAIPHICSKMQIWKKHLGILNAILGRSGVGFNTRGNHKIDCEDDTWDAILKAVSGAKGMRYKSFPYYEEWKEIFGNDRATGEAAEDIYESYNEVRSPRLDAENEDVGGDYYVNLDDIVEPECAAQSNSNSQRKTTVSSKPSKKPRTADGIAQVCEILVEIGKKADGFLLLQRVSAMKLD